MKVLYIERSAGEGRNGDWATTVITEIADYFQHEMGYEIPPMTPFVGRNFNVTRAGIHADGLLKDEEIYTIFDTKKILNRPAAVQISKTSGLAGIAYWVNQHYTMADGTPVDKRDPLIVSMKTWIDQEYEDERQTAMTDKELHEMVEQLAPGRFRRI